ncbi:MAG: Hydroxypyruvate reductase [Candidatus Peregrinibacteria bacterium GW2011_GWA2_47_7]|nr:MAG: Hydroxypyruvate reductase [Candidatus Peregrinibacteria bacterium GW2011_GWA2_47_7]
MSRLIKNKINLIRNLPPELGKRRQDLLSIVEYVIENTRPENLIRKTSFTMPARSKKIYVIAIGKAARPMAEAVKNILGKRIKKILFADRGHPLPTQDSIRNAKKIVDFAVKRSLDDFVIVLVSGGGSVMFTLPVMGVTLSDLITTTSVLLASGATIQEMNIVRKHLSQVSGGNLARLLSPAKVLGLVISDVIGNDLSSIASGPLTPDSSTFKDAICVLKKYKLLKKIPSRVLKHLSKASSETPKPGSPCFKNVSMKIIGDHMTVIEKALEKGRQLGYQPIPVTNKLSGESSTVATFMTKNAAHWNKKSKKPLLYISAGETTVTLRGKGAGGRNQEFVLSALREIDERMTVLSVGTDGVDGSCPSAVAGAIGDTANKGADIEKYLRDNDSYHYFKKHGGLIKTGKTRTNLGDLVIIAVS